MGHISEILKNLEILLYYFLFRRQMYTVDLGSSYNRVKCIEGQLMEVNEAKRDKFLNEHKLTLNFFVSCTLCSTFCPILLTF